MKQTIVLTISVILFFSTPLFCMQPGASSQFCSICQNTKKGEFVCPYECDSHALHKQCFKQNIFVQEEETKCLICPTCREWIKRSSLPKTPVYVEFDFSRGQGRCMEQIWGVIGQERGTGRRELIVYLKSNNLTADDFAEFLGIPIQTDQGFGTNLQENLSQIIELDISENNIACFPSTINLLKGLEVFWLSNNPIELLPPEIGSLQNLRVLYCSKTKISSLPQELVDIKSLKKIILNYNDNLDPSDPVMQQLIQNGVDVIYAQESMEVQEEEYDSDLELEGGLVDLRPGSDDEDGDSWGSEYSYDRKFIDDNEALVIRIPREFVMSKESPLYEQDGYESSERFISETELSSQYSSEGRDRWASDDSFDAGRVGSQEFILPSDAEDGYEPPPAEQEIVDYVSDSEGEES